MNIDVQQEAFVRAGYGHQPGPRPARTESPRTPPDHAGRQREALRPCGCRITRSEYLRDVR